MEKMEKMEKKGYILATYLHDLDNHNVDKGLRYRCVCVCVFPTSEGPVPLSYLRP